MNSARDELSNVRIYRLRAQGYACTREELKTLVFGHRFALRLCTVLISIGVITASVYVLLFTLLIATLAVFLPYHPFDYFYNHWLSKRMKKPKLPPRSRQLKFACGMAALFVGTTAMLFYGQYHLAGYILGASMMIVALLVSTIDLCIPSMIYNAFFGVKTKQRLANR